MIDPWNDKQKKQGENLREGIQSVLFQIEIQNGKKRFIVPHTHREKKLKLD